MPWIKGKFYMNPFYGRALERARSASEGQPWSEDSSEFESGLFHKGEKSHSGAGTRLSNLSLGRDAGSAHTSPANKSAHTGGNDQEHRHQHGNRIGGDYHDPARTVEGVANQIYNETAGLRTTNKNNNGAGSDVDMQAARNAMAHVIRNRAKSGMRSGLASASLTPQADRTIGEYASPAHDAHGESLFEARRAASQADPTGGATHFYLDSPHKQKPKWANNPVATFGPFENVAGGGDVQIGDPVRILILR